LLLLLLLLSTAKYYGNTGSRRVEPSALSMQLAMIGPLPQAETRFCDFVKECHCQYG